MKNKDKIILDLCGGTGSWSKPYKDAGYNVRLITLPEFSVSPQCWGIKDDNFYFFSQLAFATEMIIPIRKVYGILAAPPCTMFSRARTTAKTPRDFQGALEVVRACLEIIWLARSAGSLKFWALENPMGLLRQFIGNPAYSFKGWEFGDNHVKFTDLWGYFNNPVKKRGTRAPGFNRKNWASPKKPKEFSHLKLDRAGIRAITPKNFAKAFYKANK